MRVRTLLVSVAALSALGGASPALALFKVVGPDGKVTYTDRQPEPNGQASAVKPVSEGAAAAVALPFELRQAMSKFPVTLYTKDKCAPCADGRAHLKSRGVPFVEKTVNTQTDAEAFQRAEGTTQIPVLRIGGQQLLGFSSANWSAYLDAAGYPKKSTLPPNYRFSPAEPMVAREALAAPASNGEAAAQPRSPAGRAVPAPAPAPAPTPAPPGGIRF